MKIGALNLNQDIPYLLSIT